MSDEKYESHISAVLSECPNADRDEVREAFEKYGGFDEKLRIAADFDLMLRFMDVHKLKSVYLNKVGVHMKLGGESNRSLENIRKGNFEIRSSFKKYGLKPRKFYTIRRYISKIIQLR